MQSESDSNETVDVLYDKLDNCIQEYIKALFKEEGSDEEDDYIASWALVVNFGNIDQADGFAGGYTVETMPAKMAPHSTKGLFLEGIDWVKEQQIGYIDHE